MQMESDINSDDMVSSDSDFDFTHTHARTHAHTHTTVLRPSWILSGTTWVSQHLKGKTMKVKPIWI